MAHRKWPVNLKLMFHSTSVQMLLTFSNWFLNPACQQVGATRSATQTSTYSTNKPKLMTKTTTNPAQQMTKHQANIRMSYKSKPPSSNPYIGLSGHFGVSRDASRRQEPKIRVPGSLRQASEVEELVQLFLSQVIKIVRKVRPDWPREDIILHRLPSSAEAGGGSATSFGAYTDNKGEAVIVRVYSEETG